MQNAIFFSNSTDPYYNHALEQVLGQVPPEDRTLFLHRDEASVSIGKTQNAWRACRFSVLEQEGGKLLRRTSGGGAMYRDAGTLSYTFITRPQAHDFALQCDILRRAVAMLGIVAEVSQEGCLLCVSDGMRLNAFALQNSGVAVIHQGVLFVNADLKRMARYLAPASARGLSLDRVRNLQEYAPSLQPEAVKRALVEAFIRGCGPARMGQLYTLNREAIARAHQKEASWDWRLGPTARFALTLEKRFPFGGLELQLSLRNGVILDACAYSDAMDTAFIDSIAPALKGRELRSAGLAEALRALSGAEDIALWFEELGF